MLCFISCEGTTKESQTLKHLVDIYLLTVYYVLNSGDTAVSQLTKRKSSPHEAFLLVQTHTLNHTGKCVLKMCARRKIKEGKEVLEGAALSARGAKGGLPEGGHLTEIEGGEGL